MSQYILYAGLGLGSAAMYAALALGLVLTYRGSGVVNFGYAAMGMMGTYVFVGLRNDGILKLPVPGLPDISFGGQPLSFALALLVALLFAALLGWLCQVLVFHPLRHATELAKVIAAVGLMTLLQAVAVTKYGSNLVTVPPNLPQATIAFAGQQIPVNRLIIAGIVVGVAVLLWLTFKFARIGLAIRAVNENELGATLLGWSPRRIGAITWIASSMLSTLIGVLIAPITSLTASSFTLLIIPALAAALVARFRSFPVAALAGFGIGIAEAIVTGLQTTYSSLADLRGIQDLVPLAVAILALVVVGERMPVRGSMVLARLPISPTIRRPGLSSATLVAVAVVALAVTHNGWRFSLITTLISILLCLSLVVITGYVGQISLFQLTISGLTGFFASVALTNWGFPFPLSAIVAVVIGAAIGVVLGLPALRVRGVSLAIVTLALAFGANTMLFQNDAFVGAQAPRSVGRPHLFGLDLGISSPSGDYRLAFAIVLALVVGVAYYAVANLRSTSTGRQFLAVRANERAAAALGIHPAAVKLRGFAVSACLASIAGCAFAYSQVGSTLDFSSFDAFSSVALLAFAFLGGIARPGGAVVGAALGTGSIVSYAMSQAWSGFNTYLLVFGGLSLILTVVFNPDGIAGAPSPRELLRRRRAAAGGGPPVAVASGPGAGVAVPPPVGAMSSTEGRS